MSKIPRAEANVVAETPVSNQQQSPKVEGDESFYYELEVALEQDFKEEDEKEQEEEKEEAEERHGEVEKGKHVAVAEEHRKEMAAVRKSEKKNIVRKQK